MSNLTESFSLEEVLIEISEILGEEVRSYVGTAPPTHNLTPLVNELHGVTNDDYQINLKYWRTYIR